METKGNIILRIINARMSVPTWLMLLQNLMVAMTILLLGIFHPAGLGGFGDILPFGGILFGSALLAGCLSVMVGMIRKSRDLTKWSSAATLGVWVFGTVLFAATPGGGLNIVLLVAPWMVYFVYMYLAAIFRVKHMEDAE
jgi:hypothetical protein